jgi:hypothetical protein
VKRYEGYRQGYAVIVTVTLHDRWPKLPFQDKRKIVEALIDKITIGDGEIDIMFSHLPSSEELCKNQQKLTVLSGSCVGR